MTPDNNLPAPNAPMVDLTNGQVTQVWWQLFLTFFNKLGGGSSSTDLTQILKAIAAVQTQADYQSVVPSDAALQEALRRIADLESQQLGPQNISALQRRLDDLEAQALDIRTPQTQSLEQWNAPTLLNSWVNYGSPFNPAGYWKDPFGVVHLRGTIKLGTIGSLAFLLPVGYRPVNTELLVCISNGAVGRVSVSGAGGVNPDAGNNTYVSLDGLTFTAAQ